MQGNVLGQSGAGSKIKGLIEEYQVADGEKIKAGDFVNVNNKTINTLLEGQNLSTKGVVVLDENNLLYILIERAKMYGMLVKINDNIITKIGTPVLLLSNFIYSGFNDELISLARVNSHSVLIAGDEDVVLISIDNDLITTNYVVRYSATNSDYGIGHNRIHTIDKNRFVVLNITKINSSYYLYGAIGTIKGNTITINKREYIKHSSDSFYIVTSIEKENKIYYGLSENNGNFVLTVSDDNSFMNNPILASPSEPNFKITSKNQFIYYKYYKESISEIFINKYVNSDTSPKTLKILNFIGTEVVDEDKIIVICRKVTALYCFVFQIRDSGDFLTVNNFFITSTAGNNSPSLLEIVKINKYKFLISYYVDEKIKQIILSVNEILKPNILGIAKTSGKSGDTIKVIVPNYDEEEGE